MVLMAQTTKGIMTDCYGSKKDQKVLREAALEDIYVLECMKHWLNRNKLPYECITKLLDNLNPSSDSIPS